MKDLIKKWWFWVILLAIVIVIGFTVIVIIGFNIVKGDFGELAIEIQEIYEDATIYSSAGNNTLVLELNNWDNEYNNKLSQIINIVKTKVNNNELQAYTKFITLSYIKSSEKENVLFVKTTYNLPDFTEENTKDYIDFEEYQNLYKTLNKTMNGYTNLFNSTY